MDKWREDSHLDLGACVIAIQTGISLISLWGRIQNPEDMWVHPRGSGLSNRRRTLLCMYSGENFSLVMDHRLDPVRIQGAQQDHQSSWRFPHSKDGGVEAACPRFPGIP